MGVKRTAAITLVTLLTALASPAFAQDSTEEALPGTGRAALPGATMSGAQEARLADALRDVRDGFASSRVSNGIWSLVGGLVIAGLGGYVAYTAFEEEPTDFGLGLFGLGITGYGLNNIVSGIWNLSYPTPQERIAGKMFDNPAQLRASGMLFLEQEAYRAKRERLVGGTLSIMTGASAGILLVPLLQGDRTGQDTILLALVGLTSGLQVLEGIVTLFGSTAAERRYEEIENTMNASFNFTVSPTIVASSDEDGVQIGPAVAVGARF
jgi:hypothetical protein